MIKKITLALLLAICLSSQITFAQTNYTLIPDKNFESFLASYDDTPSDGKIPTENIIDITVLRLENTNISDLTGIKSFTGLKSLISINNPFSEIDLSANSELAALNIRNAKNLTDLNIDNNINLKLLYINNTELTSLDISKNVQLTALKITNNSSLGSIDISTNTKLKILDIVHNPKVEFINASNNILLERLRCSYNIKLKELELPKNDKLKTVESINNPMLIALDFSHNPTLGAVKCYNNAVLETLNIKNGNNENVYSFDAGNCPKLSCILIDDELEVFENSGIYRNWDKDDSTRFTEDCEADVTKYYIIIPDPNFEKKLRLWDNPLGIGDGLFPKSKINEVKELSISHENIEDLTGIEYFTELEKLECDNNKIKKLDLSNNTKLTRLNCSDNQLTELNLKNGNNTSIINFDARDNPDLKCIQIDDETPAIDHYAPYQSYKWKKDDQCRFSEDCSRDVTINYVVIPDIEFEKSLQTYDNAAGKGDGLIPKSNILNIKELNITLRNIKDLTGIEAFNSLEKLQCAGNDLKVLDLSNNTLLTTLNCSNNDLESLKLPDTEEITSIICSFNELTVLDLTGKPNLTQFNSLGNSSLSCIQVDHEEAAQNRNGIYASWTKNYSTNYSESCFSLSVETIPIETPQFIITPNPSKGLFTISGHKDLEAIEIYDSTGKRVFKKTIVSDHKIDINLSSLTKGIYIVKIGSIKNISLKKVILQ